MKRRIKIFFHSLTMKWILITCIVVLPVNILTVVIAGLMSQSYQKNLIVSYNGQLTIYGRQVDSELSRMQKVMQGFLDSSNLLKLTLGSEVDSVVEVTRFKNSLTGIKNWGTYSGICFVWDKEKDIISFFHQGFSYSMDTIEQLEEQFRINSLMEGSNVGWRWVSAQNTAFVAQYYVFPYYSIGILLDTKGILKSFFENAESVNSCIYLADYEGKILARYSETGFETEHRMGAMTRFHTISEMEKDRNQIVLKESFAAENYQLVQVMEKSELIQNLPAMMVIIYLLSIISFISLPVVCVLAVRLVIVPLQRLVEAMGKVKIGDLEYHLESTGNSQEMDYLYLQFNHMVEELNRLVIETYEKEIEKLQSDAINMRLQVNQHMLLNFLNTIYNLSQVGKNEEIGEFSLLLMKYFRYVLRQNMALVTVKEELEFVLDYLKLQKMRYPNSFTFVYSVKEEAEGIQIPQLLIENFVENIMKYGLVMCSEIEIIINARVEADRLVVSVCDTGNGMTPQVLEKLQAGEIIEDRTGNHIGIWNCRRRLKYYYGDDYRMEITSELGAGTQIWVEMPTKPTEPQAAARKTYRMEQKGQQDEYFTCG